jgi:hypothetical protein
MSKDFFITGIPTSGKSYLAEKLAKETGGVHVRIDDWREKEASDPRFKQAINFYLDQDEKTYYTTTTFDEQWVNLVWQSEELWPGIIEYIQSFAGEARPVIFEGVNLLPHLVKRDLDWSGLCLIGTTFEETLRRNIADPRWGDTEELQKLEAESFFYGERPRYQAEAQKCGYSVFTSAEEAYPEVLKLL